MEAYANALFYAIPFFISLLLIEIGYGYFVKKQMHTALDTISSLSSGITNTIKDSLGIAAIIVSYPFMLNYFSIYSIQETWLVYVVAFVAIDFATYWNHRLSHKINFFWNQHVIHHSSEEFNLACALRQSISNLLGYFPLLLLPAALLGVPTGVIAILTPLHLFAQFWYHTKHIGKLGFLEYIIVTPSQHRVHHAINAKYIDKNLAAIFCVWDRLFGTFQEELDEEPPIYGVLKPVHTWNPILINFQHIWRLFQDAWRTRSWSDKLKIWFMPTGWRPKDVSISHPIAIINNPKQLVKYNSKPSVFLIYWSVFQLISTLSLLLFMLYNFSHISAQELLLYGMFILLSVYGYTTLMDKKSYAVFIEGFRTVLGLSLIIISGNWFGIESYFNGSSLLIGLYFIATGLGAIYVHFTEIREIKRISLT